MKKQPTPFPLSALAPDSSWATLGCNDSKTPFIGTMIRPL
jgi:hypothetical protein